MELFYPPNGVLHDRQRISGNKNHCGKEQHGPCSPNGVFFNDGGYAHFWEDPLEDFTQRRFSSMIAHFWGDSGLKKETVRKVLPNGVLEQ